MRRPDLLIFLILISVLFSSLWLGAASGQEAAYSSRANQLILNIYIDDGGRCLVNGYVEDPISLPFLNSSEYSYEEENRQLYAITNALTSKSADNWSVRFESEGIYEEYRIIFYLPADARLSGVYPSQGLDYLVYAANNSVVAEVHGHDITDPAVDIGYALQLSNASAAKADTLTSAGAGGGAGGSNPEQYPIQYVALALFILLLAGLGIQVYYSRRRSKSERSEISSAAGGISIGPVSTGQGGPEHNSERNSEHNTDSTPARALSDEKNVISGLLEGQAEFRQDEADRTGFKAGIEIPGDLAAVMATLTDKEKSILKGLLQRGGRMTQRDISYETDISKSSLSGILTSMEKRKLITKREKGRTNIIELSERFKNNKERF